MIRVLCGEINYGGRVTDDKDRRLMNNLLEIFICEGVISSGYKFSPSGNYVSTDCETVEEHYAVIRELPPVRPSPHQHQYHHTSITISTKLELET